MRQIIVARAAATMFLSSKESHPIDVFGPTTLWQSTRIMTDGPDGAAWEHSSPSMILRIVHELRVVDLLHSAMPVR
jgi:hypothetical protein